MACRVVNCNILFLWYFLWYYYYFVLFYAAVIPRNMANKYNRVPCRAPWPPGKIVGGVWCVVGLQGRRTLILFLVSTVEPKKKYYYTGTSTVASLARFWPGATRRHGSLCSAVLLTYSYNSYNSRERDKRCPRSVSTVKVVCTTAKKRVYLSYLTFLLVSWKISRSFIMPHTAEQISKTKNQKMALLFNFYIHPSAFEISLQNK